MPVDMQLVSVTRLPGNGCAHVLDIAKPKKKNVKRTGLPLGLKLEPRKRRKKTVKSQVTATGSNDTNPLVGHEDLKDGLGLGLQALVTDMVTDANESNASSDKDANSSGSDSSSSSSDTEGEEVPAFPAQRKEEQTTREILRQSAALSTLVEEASVPTVAASRAGRVTTQCNMSLGVCEIGTQVAARLAKCRFCDNKIARGDGRVGYAFSKIKFHAYVHLRCLPEYLSKQQGDVQQAVKFIRDWLVQKADSPNVSSNLRMELGDLLSELERASA